MTGTQIDAFAFITSNATVGWAQVIGSLAAIWFAGRYLARQMAHERDMQAADERERQQRLLEAAGRLAVKCSAGVDGICDPIIDGARHSVFAKYGATPHFIDAGIREGENFPLHELSDDALAMELSVMLDLLPSVKALLTDALLEVKGTGISADLQAWARIRKEQVATIASHAVERAHTGRSAHYYERLRKLDALLRQTPHGAI